MGSILIREANDVSAIELEAFKDENNETKYRSKITLSCANRNITSIHIDIEKTIKQFRSVADALEKMYKKLKEGDMSKWGSPF